jgi:peptidoglycan/LPS O-acetylase OafA/YrhL
LIADNETLATVASVIAGFGSAMLAFRLEREVEGQEQGQRAWIPWADWLLIAAILLSLAAVILPIVTFDKISGLAARIPPPPVPQLVFCCAAIFLRSSRITDHFLAEIVTVRE